LRRDGATKRCRMSKKRRDKKNVNVESNTLPLRGGGKNLKTSQGPIKFEIRKSSDSNYRGQKALPAKVVPENHGAKGRHAFVMGGQSGNVRKEKGGEASLQVGEMLADLGAREQRGNVHASNQTKAF